MASKIARARSACDRSASVADLESAIWQRTLKRKSEDLTALLAPLRQVRRPHAAKAANLCAFSPLLKRILTCCPEGNPLHSRMRQAINVLRVQHNINKASTDDWSWAGFMSDQLRIQLSHLCKLKVYPKR